MENEIIKTGLVALLEEKNISEETALSIAPSFEDFYTQTVIWQHKTMNFLQDPNISQEEKAKEARIARLALVKVRTGIDKKRKELNDDDNKRIKERNNAAGILTDLVTPIEEILLAEEKAQEIAQKAANDKIKEDRETKLLPYGIDSTFYDLINMPDNLFDQLFENSKLAYESKIHKEKEAEEQRLLEEKNNHRLNILLSLGFGLDEDPIAIEEGKEHYYNEDIGVGIIISLKSMSDEEFNAQVLNCKEEIYKYKNKQKLKAEAAEKETARLKAEKEELERAENARKQKHAAGIARQQMLALISSNMPFDEVSEMDEEAFNAFYKSKKEIFDAEQLKIYKEKKKKEIEDAQAAKLKVEKEAADRAAKLAPDKTKIQKVIDEMQMPAISTLEFKGGETEALYATIQGKFEAFKKWANEQVNTLK